MFREVVWTLVPVSVPFVHRHCRRCGRDRPFASSGKFRVNASGRRLDVWLVYRCTGCEETWNRTVHERVTPEDLGARLEAYHRNDEEAAQRCALGAGGEVEVAVERPEVVLPAAVRFRLAAPARVRLDRLLARELGVTRAQIAARLEPGQEHLLRRPIRDGQVIVLR